MAESELYLKGAAMRRRLMGDVAVERSAREIYSDPVMKKFIDVATETVFGALWTRPGLDLKTRALICVISDAATGREPELGLHLRMALRQGWSEEELTEALLHLSGYVGVPIIRESMMVASKAFAEYRAEQAAQKTSRLTSHLLVIPSWYSDGRGSGGGYFRDQALALKTAGHRVAILAPTIHTWRDWRAAGYRAQGADNPYRRKRRRPDLPAQRLHRAAAAAVPQPVWRGPVAA